MTTAAPATTTVAQAPVARLQVFGAAVAVAIALTAGSFGYGYHRDELYFRLLGPAWGYVDQPPFTPWLVRTFSSLIDDSVWAIRIPATLAAAASVVVVALITRELGGGKAAQTLSAWAYGFAAVPLLFGHVMLTATVDLVVWPTVTLLVIRALMRQQGWCWVASGALIGLSTFNKLLIVMLVISLVAGLLITGPRKVLWSKHFLLAAMAALLLSVPAIVYQLTHDWPQLTMGAALSEDNADSVRVMMWPFLFLMLGPPLVPVWIAGWVALARRPQWRPVRFLAAAFPVLLLLSFLAGGQIYYPVGLLTVLFAAGCIPTIAFFHRSARWWRPVAAVLLAINVAVAAVIALPLVPVSMLGDTPIGDINQTARDQVGWEAYVGQVAAVVQALPTDDRTVIITSNYGEAGAIDRYGSNLPEVYSGHNQLYFQGSPPESATVAVLVGEFDSAQTASFGSCQIAGTLNNLVDVDNEEQDQPITVCRDPLTSWAALWPKFQHYG